MDARGGALGCVAGGTPELAADRLGMEGRLPSGRERRSHRHLPWAGACCHPPVKGRSRERGTPAVCPRHPRSRRRPPGAGERRGVHRGPSSVAAGHRGGDRPAGEGQDGSALWEPDQFFFLSFFPLSPLSCPSLLRLPSPFPSARRSIPPRDRRRRGGSRHSLGCTPRPVRGDGGMW